MYNGWRRGEWRKPIRFHRPVVRKGWFSNVFLSWVHSIITFCILKVVVSLQPAENVKGVAKNEIPKVNNPKLATPHEVDPVKKTTETGEASQTVSVADDSDDENRTKGSVTVLGVGAEVVKRLIPGNIVVLIGAFIENETIFSDNESWIQVKPFCNLSLILVYITTWQSHKKLFFIQVVEPSFNKKASELHDWSQMKEKDPKKRKLWMFYAINWNSKKWMVFFI